MESRMCRWILIPSLFALSIVSCSAPVREYACKLDPELADVEVHTVWTCNRDVLRRVVRGKKFSLREFQFASEFFEDLTGMRADWQEAGVGTIPGPDLKHDLDDLDAWYELNMGRLRWDAGLGKIVFEGLAPTAGGR